MPDQFPDAVHEWHDDDRPDSELSNAAMKERARAALVALNDELDAAYAKVLSLSQGGERNAVEAVQSSWLAYRSSIQNYAREKFGGGTNAGLAAAGAAIAETERHIAVLNADIQERIGREGQG